MCIQDLEPQIVTAQPPPSTVLHVERITTKVG